jgi:hypothetical protein
MADASHRANLDQWRSILGDKADALWNAFDEPPAIELPRPLRRAARESRWKFATAASLAACLIVSALAIRETDKLDDARVQFALGQLQGGDPSAQLGAANFLRARSNQLDRDALGTLEHAIATADDPNVQLEILEILVRAGSISDEHDLQKLSMREGPRARFLRASYVGLYSKGRTP